MEELHSRSTLSNQPYLLLLSDRAEFTYLFQRYAQRSGYAFQNADRFEDVLALVMPVAPAAIIVDEMFAAYHSGRMLHQLYDTHNMRDVPRLLCVKRDELEPDLEDLADVCLITPIIYSEFIRGLSFVGLGNNLTSHIPGGTETVITIPTQ